MRTLHVLPAALLAASGCLGAGPHATPEAADSGPVHGPDTARIEQLWANQTRKRIVDRWTPWHTDDDNVDRTRKQATQTLANSCTTNGDPYFNNHRITFDEAHQTVWPGTEHLDARLDWNDTDSTVREVALAYRAQRTHTFNETQLVPRGTTFRITVEPQTWDDADAPTTSWELWVCVNRGNGQAGRFFLGGFHLRLSLVRDA